MSKLTVTLPDELHEQIRQELEAQGITTGQFIEMVVTKYFTKSKESKGQNPAIHNRRRPLDERQADWRTKPKQIAVISQKFVGLQQAG